MHAGQDALRPRGNDRPHRAFGLIACWLGQRLTQRARTRVRDETLPVISWCRQTGPRAELASRVGLYGGGQLA
jgi:hypothetical protein